MPDWIGSRVPKRSFIVTVAQFHAALAADGIELGQRISPGLSGAIEHVLLSNDGGRTGMIDRIVDGQGLRRHLTATGPHFQAVALTVAGSDPLGSLPVRYAQQVPSSAICSTLPCTRGSSPTCRSGAVAAMLNFGSPVAVALPAS